ncbi:hypothetical protein UY456_24145 [Paenibacillus polymyxa]|uniref:hypothetical protein n=3 Tax=Paenibacillus polymyxa TaxID=1406 RepID=UPI0026BE5CBF|nr:hypothetical protein [Paenibacillus polymyxa]MDY8096067.1 hypothetical protein [Paenibacillus polymyxa]
MEKEGASRFMSDDEFMKLVELAQTKSDVEAMNAYFDPDIKRLSKFIRMPKEDAIQSMKTELLEFIMKK